MIFKVGQVVKDDLTGELVTVERVNIDSNGNVGLFVSSEYLGGGRHSWEVSTEEELGEEYFQFLRLKEQVK
jgi:hypothetical protein